MSKLILETCDYCDFHSPRLGGDYVKYDSKIFCDEMCRFAYIGEAAMRSPEEAMEILDRNQLFVRERKENG